MPSKIIGILPKSGHAEGKTLAEKPDTPYVNEVSKILVRFCMMWGKRHLRRGKGL